MKRSLFSPLNIIIVAAIAAGVWFYMKHVQKSEEAQPVATEQVAVVVEEEPTIADVEAVTETEEAK